MLRKSVVAVLVVAVVAAVATGAFAQRATMPTLKGTVGPGFTIMLKRNGKLVKTLRHGTYKFVIADRSSNHAFSLDGPHGFAKDFSKIPFVGTKTATVKLKAGKYKYYCPNHESIMFHHFKVT